VHGNNGRIFYLSHNNMISCRVLDWKIIWTFDAGLWRIYTNIYIYNYIHNILYDVYIGIGTHNKYPLYKRNSNDKSASFYFYSNNEAWVFCVYNYSCSCIPRRQERAECVRPSCPPPYSSIVCIKIRRIVVLSYS